MIWIVVYGLAGDEAPERRHTGRIVVFLKSSDPVAPVGYDLTVGTR